jgi:hypothetical protein
MKRHMVSLNLSIFRAQIILHKFGLISNLIECIIQRLRAVLRSITELDIAFIRFLKKSEEASSPAEVKRIRKYDLKDSVDCFAIALN